MMRRIIFVEWLHDADAANADIGIICFVLFCIHTANRMMHHRRGDRHMHSCTDSLFIPYTHRTIANSLNNTIYFGIKHWPNQKETAFL